MSRTRMSRRAPARLLSCFSAWLRSVRVWDWLLAPKPLPLARRTRLNLEALEAREVPAIAVTSFANTDVLGSPYTSAFTAEMRAGNVNTNGTHELDVSNSTSGPFLANETNQLKWVNGQAYTFDLTYDPAGDANGYTARLTVGGTVIAKSIQDFAGLSGDDTLLIRTFSGLSGKSIELSGLSITVDGETLSLPTATSSYSGGADRDLLQVATTESTDLCAPYVMSAAFLELIGRGMRLLVM